jgi:hypothetical protein
MRTTLNIPEDLLAEAQAILGYQSKTDVIIYSLRELIRKKKLEELASLSGKIHLKIDLHKSRKRPNRKKKI